MGKQECRDTIDKYAPRVLGKFISQALEGNVQCQKWIIDRYLDGQKAKLRGATPSELVNSLIKQSRKPGISQQSVKNAIDLIKIFTETYQLENIEQRLKELEKLAKKKKK